MSRQGLESGEMEEVGEKTPGDEQPPLPCSQGSRWVIQCNWVGTMRWSPVRVGVTRESAGHGYKEDRRWLSIQPDTQKKQGLLLEGRKAKI